MHFGIKDLIDVLLVAFFLYQTYKLMKSSGTLAIFSGVVSFIVVWILISQVLEMRLMGAILDKFISVGFVVLVILFQDEIRRFLLALGSHRGWKFLGKLFSKRGGDPEKEGKFVAPVVLACMNGWMKWLPGKRSVRTISPVCMSNSLIATSPVSSLRTP